MDGRILAGRKKIFLSLGSCLEREVHMKEKLIRAGVLFLLLFFGLEASAQRIRGTVTDIETGEGVFGAGVLIEGTQIGTTTDFDGNFELNPVGQTFPLTIQVSYIGYESAEIEVKNSNVQVRAKLKPTSFNLNDVTVVESRITKKQKEAALTVESMDVIAIKEAASGSFYESLGNLKGVDMTSASLAFKIINTRGFNSTSPVRSLQIIDGVDNQAPGLNFSLGNFLGASDLDVARVNIIAGASSAFFGPGAFNGVIQMETKDPWRYEGISASLKVGERSLTETAVRYANVWQNKDGEDKFAIKLNLFYLSAYDWEATNDQPIYESDAPFGNPGGWDRVNWYGDEDVSRRSNDYTDALSLRDVPGLGIVHRTGYSELDLVDYNTRNGKFATSLHYKVKPDVELIYALNYGTGTTVYQGDNRYSLKNIQFLQNRFEIKKEGKWFLRAYLTNENAGDTYDAVFTAFQMQDVAKDIDDWLIDYKAYWRSVYSSQVRDLTGLDANGNTVSIGEVLNTFPFDEDLYYSLLEQNNQTIQDFHDVTRMWTDSTPRVGGYAYFEPGTARYDSIFDWVTSRSFQEGGSRFYDKSALYHIHGEYKFTPMFGDIVVGGNFRQYLPDSRGTIFYDTADVVIRNSEFGAYIGLEKKLMMERLKLNATLRMDKNQNFDYVFSPAVSAVFSPDEKNTIRLTFSSAVRNPTLQDQYLYYNVGRAILIGNLDGYDSLITLQSFSDYIGSLQPSELEYFDVAPISPEQVRTIELGYRATLGKKAYVDLTYYYSMYDNFIGFNVGVDAGIPNQGGIPPSSVQVYRIAANSRDRVFTQGFSIGANYYLNDNYILSGNYSWNRIDLRDSDDPIIPAFNTPEHKYNLGLTGRDLTILGVKNLGWSVNYKWVDSFLFEGSPQFTGIVPSYSLVDVQANYSIPDWNLLFKVGASNVLNNDVVQVYGGPTVGRLVYGQVIFDLDFKK